MNDVEKLERKLDQLLLEPSSPQLLNQIGVLLYQMKDWQNAEVYFQRAYQLNERNEDILYNFASVLYRLGKWQEAITFYQTYLELCPNDENVIEKVGDCSYQLGDYQLARKMYNQLNKCKEENL